MTRAQTLARTLERLSQNLQSLTQLQTQLEAESETRLEVSKKWPSAINEAKQYALDVYLRLNELEGEIEASIGHHEEAHTGLQVSVDKLNDIRTILGDRGSHIHLLLAGDPTNVVPILETGAIATGLPELVVAELSDTAKEVWRKALG